MEIKNIKHREMKLSDKMEFENPDTDHALYNVVLQLEEYKNYYDSQSVLEDKEQVGRKIVEELIETIWICFSESEQ
jgi:hypothetical protein